MPTDPIVDTAAMERGRTGGRTGDDAGSVHSEVSLFRTVTEGFRRIFQYDMEPVPEEPLEDDEDMPPHQGIDTDDPRFLSMVNQKTSDIDDFRTSDYPVEKENLERRLEDQKSNLKKSMDTYTDTRSDRRSKETELDSIKLMETLHGKQVNKDVNAVEAISHQLSDLNYKFKVSEYLGPKNQAPKLYAERGYEFARQHSKLNTQDAWDQLNSLNIEALQVLHGFRCTNLGLKADPHDDEDSRVFTYSQMKVKSKDGPGLTRETPEQYVERLKKAMGWNYTEENEQSKRLRLINEHKRKLAELEAEQEEHASKRCKRGEHKAEE